MPIFLSKPIGQPRLHANGRGTFQACLEDRLQWNPVVNDEEAIDKCVEELTSTIQ
jgi:hypothetical protein